MTIFIQLLVLTGSKQSKLVNHYTIIDTSAALPFLKTKWLNHIVNLRRDIGKSECYRFFLEFTGFLHILVFTQGYWRRFYCNHRCKFRTWKRKMKRKDKWMTPRPARSAAGKNSQNIRCPLHVISHSEACAVAR